MEALGELSTTGHRPAASTGWPVAGPFVGQEAADAPVGAASRHLRADALVPIGDFIDAADRVVVERSSRVAQVVVRDERGADGRLHGARGQLFAHRALRDTRKPSKPWAVGVGDVAGERGDRAPGIRRVECGRTWMRFRELYDPNVVLRSGQLAGAGTVRRSRGRHAPDRTEARDLGGRHTRTDR